MISILKFHIFCKPQSVLQNEFDSLLENLPLTENQIDTKHIIHRTNNFIKRKYGQTFYKMLQKPEKKYKQFTNEKNIVKHFDRIYSFLKEKSNYMSNMHFSFYIKVCFTVAMNYSNITNECQDFSIDGVLINIAEFMRLNSIIKSSYPSKEDSLFITIGDLCFMFANKLLHYNTDTQTNKTAPYLTSVHTGDIKLIYKTLCYRVAFEKTFDIREVDQFYSLDLTKSIKLEDEIDLIEEMGLLGVLYEYSKTIKDKIDMDDRYIAINVNKEDFTNKIPFYFINGMLHECDLKQIVGIVLLTYRAERNKRVSKKVLHQTYSLLYPIINIFKSTRILKYYFNDLCNLMKLELDWHDFINEMDLNSNTYVDGFEIRCPPEDEILDFIINDREQSFENDLEYYLAMQLIRSTPEEFEKNIMPRYLKLELLKKFTR